MDSGAQELRQFFKNSTVQWGWQGYDMMENQMKECLGRAIMSVDAFDPNKKLGVSFEKSEILDAQLLREEPQFLLETGSMMYFYSHFGSYFQHDQALEWLSKTLKGKYINNCLVIINEKSHKEALIKVLFRGGRLDDIHRAMILIEEGDQPQIDSIANDLKNGLPADLDYFWENDQDKSWPCIKFCLFSKQRRLKGKVSPVEIQILSYPTFCALKTSTQHKVYEIRRLKKVSECRQMWRQYEDNFNTLIDWSVKNHYFSKDEIELYLNLGPFQWTISHKLKVECRELVFKHPECHYEEHIPDIVIAAGNLYQLGNNWGNAWWVSEQQWPLNRDLHIRVLTYGGTLCLILTDTQNVAWNAGWYKDAHQKGITFGTWQGIATWVRNRIYHDQKGHQRVAGDTFHNKGLNTTEFLYNSQERTVIWKLNGKQLFKGPYPDDLESIKLGFQGDHAVAIKDVIIS